MSAPGYSVLVVDDDAAMRDSLRDVLEEVGHHVLLAENGRQALEVLRAHPDVGVVLLDLMMPVMNGLEFLAVKVRDRRISGIPVVLMTAHPQQTRQVVGVSTSFPKPFSTAALVHEVRRLCAR